MIDIEVFLNSLVQQNAFEQILQNNKLKSQMAVISKTHRGWRYFCYLLETGNTGFGTSSKLDMSYDPQNILALCKKLGIKTDTDLYAFVESMKNIDTEGLIDCHSPSLSLINHNLKSVSYEKVKDLIKKLLNLDESLKFSPQMDTTYLIPYENEINYILKQCPFDRLKYKADGLDCDDYAFLLRAFLSENGYGNLTIPYVVVNAYKEDKFVYAHAINLILYFDDKDEFVLQYIEPQTDHRWFPDEPMSIGMDEYDLKVRYILI